MEAVESDLDTRAKAQKEGISTGRYIRSHKDELEDKTKMMTMKIKKMIKIRKKTQEKRRKL